MGDESTMSSKRLFGLRPGALRLAAVALLMSLTLCGAEKVSGGKRDVYGPGQFNQLELSASAGLALLSGEIPPRVSPTLTGSLGNPYHQFYSPLPHSAAGAVAIILKDVVAAYSVTVVLVLSFAFVYAFRLGIYLTRSGPCAAFSACLYVTAPYVHASRTLSGAFDEYFAICLLPACLYHLLRSISRKSYKHWLLGAFFCAALLLSNLWTALSFFCFCLVYALVSGTAMLVARAAGTEVKAWGCRSSAGATGLLTGELAESGRESSTSPEGPSVEGPRTEASQGAEPVLCHGQPFSAGRLAQLSHGTRFLMRTGIAVSAAAGGILLAMYFLGPVFFYDAGMMKNAIIGLDRPGGGFVTPFLSLLSMRDTPWDWSTQFIDFSRYQAGLLIIASLAAYAWFRCIIGGRRIPSLPLLAVPVLMILLMASPSLMDLRPLDSLSMPSHAYRFLGIMTLVGTVCGGLAMKDFFMSLQGFTPAAREVAAMALCGLALVLASPYIYPDGTRYSNVTTMSSDDILRLSGMDYGESAYLRHPPPDAVWSDESVKVLVRRGSSGNARFSVDLDEYGRMAGAPPGEVFLDILYFPGLQDVEITLDGSPAALGLDTYWQRRDSVPAAADSALSGPAGGRIPGAFHGLKIVGAPSAGLLGIRVNFRGMGWANLTSLGTLLLMALGLLIACRRKSGWGIAAGRVSELSFPSGSDGGLAKDSPEPDGSSGANFPHRYEVDSGDAPPQ